MSRGKNISSQLYFQFSNEDSGETQFLIRPDRDHNGCDTDTANWPLQQQGFSSMIMDWNEIEDRWGLSIGANPGKEENLNC